MNRYHAAWFYTCAVSRVLLNDFQVSANHCAAIHTVLARLLRKQFYLSSTPESPARFALAVLPGDRGEDPAQPVFKTDISWRSEVLSDNNLRKFRKAMQW